MARYETISGIVFSFIAIMQLTRTVLRWPAQVNGLSIPVWLSVIAFLVTASLAVWAFRSARARAGV